MNHTLAPTAGPWTAPAPSLLRACLGFALSTLALTATMAMAAAI
jgi:hypothetical protein